MAVASSLEMIGGCATTETPKIMTLVYPPLPYNKIQPPQEGCLVGFFKEPDASINAITYLLESTQFFHQDSLILPSFARLIFICEC